MLQQHLPFTVLKHPEIGIIFNSSIAASLQQHLPFTVLKHFLCPDPTPQMRRLQQHLPFTVLKPFNSAFSLSFLTLFCCNSTYRLRYWNFICSANSSQTCLLQQHLPFTVLKPSILNGFLSFYFFSCNSTYRLRYWNLKQIERWRK